MSEFAFLADTKIDDVWSNQSLSKFAIVPEVESPEETAKLVDELVRAYVEAPDNRGGSETKNEVLASLYDLHASGQVLWPLGVLMDRSVLGAVTGHRFSYLIEEEDPARFQAREDIEKSRAFREAGYEGTPAKHLSFDFWRIFMTLRLATSGLEAVELVTEDHLFALVRSMQNEGLWLDWVQQHVKQRLRKFGRFLGKVLGDDLFAAAFLNPGRRMKLGPRIPSVLAANRHLSWLDAAFETWMDQNAALTKKASRQALRLLSEFMSTLAVERTAPEVAFSRENVKALLQFASSWSTSNQRGLAMSKIMDFAQWYCLDHAVAEENLKPAFELTRYDIERFLRMIPPAPARLAEVAARPMPTRFHHMLKEIISEEDFAWAKDLKNGNTGLPVHWFAWTNPSTNKVEPVFCEVLPRMLLLQLELPLRNIQVRRLDSGEGDDREFDPVSRAFRNSTGPHAGHWRRHSAKNTSRGAIREIVTSTGTVAGFWINSNKTQDASNLFDETSGYEIPWQHDEVLQNIVDMRKWQEKYNPVEGPLPHAQVPPGIFADEPTRVVRALLPDRFYLFRYPQNNGYRGKEAPPGYKIFLQFFLDALDELEKRLRVEDPASAITIITDRDVSGQPRKAIFTIHGMRASTITALHMAGVPIGILSKLIAGHATILMTLRYTKFDPAHVNQVLNDARGRMLTEQRAHFDNFLKNATLEHAMRMTARLSDDGLQQAKNTYSEPGCWSRMDIGICPNGGTLCKIGGEAIHKRKEKSGQDKSSYREVPGGSRNCVRCRFFITGLPFLLPLSAHATAILAKLDGMSKRIDSLGEEVQAAKRERLSHGDAVPASLQQRIRILEETYYSQIELRDLGLADLHATMMYIEKVRAIAAAGDASDEAKLPMLLGADGVPEVNFKESTRFELVDAVVQASRFFPSIASAENEAERDEFLNQVLWRNGYVPITLSPLTAQERRKAADALAEMLLVEIGAAETQAVIEGRKTLADLGLQAKLERAATAAIGRPMERLVLSPPTAPLIEAAAE